MPCYDFPPPANAPIVGHLTFSAPTFYVGDIGGAMLGNTSSCPKHPHGWAHCYCSGRADDLCLVCCHCGAVLPAPKITFSPPIVHGPHKVGAQAPRPSPPDDRCSCRVRERPDRPVSHSKSCPNWSQADLDWCVSRWEGPMKLGRAQRPAGAGK